MPKAIGPSSVHLLHSPSSWRHLSVRSKNINKDP
jgi:hypothetical protein